MRARLLAVTALMAVAADARAKPARMQDLELFDEYVEPCLTGKTWPVVERCLKKQGVVSIAYQTDKARVVKIAARNSPELARYHLYAQSAAGWTRSNLYASMSTTTELLGISPFEAPGGAGIQVRIGTVTRQIVSIDQTTATKRAVVRRVTSTVCTPESWACRAFVTSCEAYIDGRAYWTFHGEVFWHETLGLRIRGNAANAGPLCKPGRPFFIDAD